MNKIRDLLLELIRAHEIIHSNFCFSDLDHQAYCRLDWATEQLNNLKGDTTL